MWALIASLFIGNTHAAGAQPAAGARSGRSCCRSRGPTSTPGILFFASLGAYAVNASTFDLVLLLVLGVLGFMMRRFGLPVLPAIIGVILGPLAEQQLRRALQITDGDVAAWSEPLAIVIYCLIALILLWPLINRFIIRRLRKPAHGVHSGHAHPLVELAEELAADTDDLDHDESVLARAERVTSRRDDPSSPEKTPDKSPEKPPDKTPERTPEDKP